MTKPEIKQKLLNGTQIQPELVHEDTLATLGMLVNAVSCWQDLTAEQDKLAKKAELLDEAVEILNGLSAWGNDDWLNDGEPVINRVASRSDAFLAKIKELNNG